MKRECHVYRSDVMGLSHTISGQKAIINHSGTQLKSFTLLCSQGYGKPKRKKSITNWKRRSHDTPWNKYTLSRIGRNRNCEILDRIAFGRESIISWCCSPSKSVLYLVCKWASIRSCSRIGNRFRCAKPAAAWTVSLWYNKILTKPLRKKESNERRDMVF